MQAIILSRNTSKQLLVVARKRRRPARHWPSTYCHATNEMRGVFGAASALDNGQLGPMTSYSTTCSTEAAFRPTVATVSSVSAVRTTKATLSSAAAASATSSSYEYYNDPEVDRYVQNTMLQFLPQTRISTNRITTPSSYHRPSCYQQVSVPSASTQLDLELGDYADHHSRQMHLQALSAGAVWDDNIWNQRDDDDIEDSEYYDNEHSDEYPFEGSNSNSIGAIEPNSSISSRRRLSEQSHADEAGRQSTEQERTAATAAARRPFLKQQQQQQQPSVMELLASFDPMNPPRISDYASRDDALNAIQLWMECEAQQEAVSRYQKVIDDARARHDFASLSMIQRQIVQWFGPLQEAYEAKQKAYLQGNNNKTEPSAKKFGPFICTLPPTKLAVVVAHEAVMKSIINGQSSSHTNSVLGVPLSVMAMRLGQAVEDELVVHRLLHKRSQENAAKEAKQGSTTSSTGEASAFAHDVSAVFGSIPDDHGHIHNELSEGNEYEDYDDDDENDVGGDQVGDGDYTERDASSSAQTKSSSDPRNVTHKWSYAASHLKNYLDEISQYKPSAKKRRVTAYAIQRARQVLDRDEEWTAFEKMQLGAALLQPLLETTTIVGENGRTEPAFTLEKHWIAKDKSMSFVAMNHRLFKMIVSDKLESLSATTTRHKPMIVPPKPWTAANDGGYQMLKVDLMRYHGCHTQREAMRNAESSTVFDGLNALGKVKWKINKRLLGVAQRCWEENIPLGDIPSRTDGEVPEEPIQPAWNESRPEKGTEEYEQSIARYKEYRERLARHNRAKQKIMDLRSLRCSAMLKLDQAEKFKNFDEIYFPYNMDFRGRAYPVPPHLSNVGSDLCRGMLVFAEAKPLGDRGLYWLKVHLANFAGKDKISFDDRAKFVDDNMDKVRQSASDPFGGDRWWMTLEDPFQGLATCFEVVNAIDSGDPASYQCSLPVHMDGSCNGLQHYAALGRDSVGGKAVNLCATDEPQDVYIGVMHEVIRRVAEEADRDLGFDTSNVEALSKAQKKELSQNRAAKLVNGHIDRGVVKRTVMTSVYGVTYVGAREQIQEKVEEKLEAQGHDIDEINREVFQACGYLALITMEVIGDLFSGAKGTMNWLTTCARMISQHGYPVAWISPIGVPAIQPYRQKKTATLVTLLQTVSLAVVSDALPINKAKQVTAFPPNYIHSLDSSHMLLTALEMDRRGLTFSAVHDSFWTHPCDVDEMNVALRDVFVDLYSQPLLESLKETWEMRYPGLIFPDLPERGDLDLTEVKKAKYFFQ